MDGLEMDGLRRFVFLKRGLVSIQNTDSSPVNITSTVDTAGSDLFLWILESSGVVNMLYKPLLNPECGANILNCHSFRAFEFEATHILYCPLPEIIVVIGKDEESDSTQKFNTYSITSFLCYENSSEVSKFVQSVPVFPVSGDFPLDHIVSVTASECATLVAVSTENGNVYMYCNYVIPISEKSGSQRRLYKISLRNYFEDGKHGTVRGVHLVKFSEGDETGYSLFVCCEDCVLSLKIGSEVTVLFKDCSKPYLEMSSRVSNSEMVAVASRSGKIGLYNVRTGISHWLPSCGACSSIGSYKNYIADASLECPNTFDSSSLATLITVQSRIPEMQYVAHSQYIPRVYKFEEAMGSLYTVARSGPNNAILLFELRDKKIHERIQIFIRKRLFAWAIKLAELEGRPQNEIEDIHRIHADWLYEKGLFKESIEAYCNAGVSVEPAYVIGRFLGLNNKIHLFNYLLHIHRCNMDSSVHTILLMRCLQSLFKGALSICDSSNSLSLSNVTMVDCNSLLVGFLKEFGESRKSAIRDALQECRASGGFEFSREVALLQKDHEEYIDILIEDFSAFEKAIEYMDGMDNQIVCNVILKHGRRLIHYHPTLVLSLIKKLNQFVPEGQSAISGAFVPVFSMEEDFLTRLLLLDGSNTPFLMFSTRLHLLLEEMQSSFSKEQLGSTSKTENNILKDGNESIESEKTIIKDGKESVENRVWKLLNSDTQLVEYQMIALILCLLYGYRKGANAMAIKMGHYHLPLVLTDIPEDSQEGDNGFNLLEYALHYGYNEPTLWVGTISLLARMASRMPNLIREALQHVQNYKLLSFPTVLDILKRHDHLSFKHVKSYLRQEFKKIEEDSLELRKEIAQDILESRKMNQDLEDFQRPYIVTNNTNCSRCGLHLEIPCLHFYCQHSFHIYCVGPDNKCQKCFPISQKTDERITDKKRLDDQDDFFKFLSGSTDPFDYVSRQFEGFWLSSS